MLDPKRFQNINIIDAIGNALRGSLTSWVSAQPEHVSRPASHKPSYEKLKQFQGYREQLGLICADLVQVLQVEGGYRIFPPVLERGVQQLAQKVKSQTFRLAVVSEFSRGKSTLLNALLGEELQPVRTVPCSGTLTVLKYGVERQVICHYKDGTKATIPFDQYQQQASIPKESALGKRGFELKESNIAEIVLEHPGLELCRHHVEIVDSPGLNEHPDRTAVTERLLKNADAAIFLTHAQQLLNDNEQDLLQNLKYRLQQGESETPAENLFVLVNHMDTLRSSGDRADVMKRAQNIIRDPAKPLVSNDNRVHFISAQLALEAILEQNSNEYSEPFSKFVSSLETFLVEERGELALRKEIASVQKTISVIRESLKQVLNVLEDRLNISTADQQQILEKAGEISGSDAKIQQLTETMSKETLLDVERLQKQWKKGLKIRLSQKSEKWVTYENGKEKILRDYMEQSVKDFSEDIDRWLKERIVKSIVEPRLNELTNEINKKLNIIKDNLQSVDNGTGASLNEQFELSSSSLIEALINFTSAPIRDTTFFTQIATLISNITGAVASFILGRDIEAERHELKVEALNGIIDQFLKISDKISEKTVENIQKAFDKKAENFHKSADASISILSNLIEQKENIVQGTVEQKEAGAAIIQQKSIQLQTLETALSNLTRTALNQHIPSL